VWLFADLAIQGIGAQTVGIDPGAPASVVQRRLSSTATSVVLVEDEEQYDKVIAARPSLPALRTIVVIDDRGVRPSDDPSVLTLAGLPPASDDGSLEWPRPSDDPAKAVATILEVGSGAQCSVRAVHQSDFAGLADALQSALGSMRASDNVLAHLPLSHVTERTVSMVGALRWGYTVNIATEPDLLVSELREVQPTVFVTTAEVWQYLANSLQSRLARASRFKRWLGHRCLSRGRLPGPLGPVLWYHPARRQMGLGRVRGAVCSGSAPDSEVLSLFAALGLPIVSIDTLTGPQP
jgi:long-chain acyl-CoA synthetase